MSGELWFRAKTYGWGWTPCTWQGWAVMGVWAVALVAWMWYRADGYVKVGIVIPDAMTFAGIIVLGLALGLVCWIKGERPRWRWGK